MSAVVVPVPPNGWLAMVGGGQLGRMFCFAAQSLGYRVAVLEPDPDSPAGRAADLHLCAAYDDPQAIDALRSRCLAATTEFENVPATTLEALAQSMPVRPGAAAVAITQDRVKEKAFIAACDVPVAPYCAIGSTSDCLDAAAIAPLLPGILKSARLGYDGKGQIPVSSIEDLATAFRELGEVPCVLEKRLALAAECSVVLARDVHGQATSFDVFENTHRHGILASTVVPARLPQALCDRVRQMASVIAERLDYAGVLCVEFFVLSDGSVVANEMAPRPHNSGHPTIEACLSSQFEQQARIVAGLPLGGAQLVQPAVMLNLLGDLWGKGEPDWARVLAAPGVHLHLYSKAQAKPGRKMGHLTHTGATLGLALGKAQASARVLGLPLPS